jgi:predicted Zn-dependent peptidase
VTLPLARAPAGPDREVPHLRTVLRGGLRVVSQRVPGARSVAVALFVGVGSRHEDERHAGLSHLLEHLVFKGTASYPDPGTISATVEASGGSLNASTDRELTAYTAKLPADGAARALEVVGELVFRPLLRSSDLVAEKPVIVDEIRMYVDSPGDHVFTLFDQLLFGSHPLGREIAGSPGSVRRASAIRAREHWSTWYRPDRVVLAAAGAVDHERLVAQATAWQATWQAGAHGSPNGMPAEPAVDPPSVAPAGSLRVSYRDLGQGNLCLGMPGVSRADPDRWALDLLGAVLGDGMSSRLFLELRERRSLTYDVSTFSAMYSDAGTFGVHAGFDPDQAPVVVDAILEQLERVVAEPVADEELERARAYVRGRLELRMEDSAAVAGWLGSGETLLPRILTVEEVVERLNAVQADDILRVARRICRPGLARLVILGPFRSARRFERSLARAGAA